MSRTVKFFLGSLLLFICSMTQAAPEDNVVLLSPEVEAAIVLEKNAPSCVGYAAKDLSKDFFEATGKSLRIVGPKESLPMAIIPAVVDQSPLLKSLEARRAIDCSRIRGQWESSMILPVENPVPGIKRALIVAGSDPRGAMYGVYELSERVLGTDPLKYWTEHVPEHKDVVIWKDGNFVSKPPTFQYRGLFINDEDLLIGWKVAGKRVIPPDVDAAIIEMICRLKGNMIAPGMLAEYMTSETVKLACDRGLIYTASHLESLLGNWPMYWNNFSQDRFGKKLPYSYTQYPREIEAYWRDSIQRHKNYNNIWPVGLRGGDDAFWTADPNAPKSMAARAEVVSRVIKRQLDLLGKNLPKGTTPVACLTMMAEMIDLYQTGHLALPDNVILAWEDDRIPNTFPHLPQGEERSRKGGNGVYFHLNNADNGAVQWVSPVVIRDAFTSAVAAGATKYALFNVGDIRPNLISIAAAMNLTWDFEPWKNNRNQPQIFTENWTGKHFRAKVAKETAEIYDSYFRLERPCRAIPVVTMLAPYLTTAAHLAKKTPSMRAVAAVGFAIDNLTTYAGHIGQGSITHGNLKQRVPQWDDLYKKAIENEKKYSVAESAILFRRYGSIAPDFPPGESMGIGVDGWSGVLP